MAQLVTLMIASRGCSISGSDTVSQRMSSLPCQTSAFIPGLPIVLISPACAGSVRCGQSETARHRECS